jgi:hypothetical protein
MTHLVVVRIGRREAQVHVVDRLNTIAFFEPGTFRRSVRGDRGDENAKRISRTATTGRNAKNRARAVGADEHAAEGTIIQLALSVGRAGDNPSENGGAKQGSESHMSSSFGGVGRSGFVGLTRHGVGGLPAGSG